MKGEEGMDVNEQDIREYMKGLGYSIIARRRKVGECQRTARDTDISLKEAQERLKIAEVFYESELGRLGIERPFCPSQEEERR